MQFQSDISNIKIFKPHNIESTSLGVGIMAGLKSKIWENTDEIILNKEIEHIYTPTIKTNIRKEKLKEWKHSIKKI